MILWIGNLGVAQQGVAPGPPRADFLICSPWPAWLGAGWSRVASAGMAALCSQGPLSFSGLAQAQSHAAGPVPRSGPKGTRFLEARLRTGPRSLPSPSVDPSKSQVQPRFTEWKHPLHLFTGGAAESHCKGRAVRKGNHYRHFTVYLSPEFCRSLGVP